MPLRWVLKVPQLVVSSLLNNYDACVPGLLVQTPPSSFSVSGGGGRWVSSDRVVFLFYLTNYSEVRLFWSSYTTGSPSSKYVVYATAYVYRELYGKITDRKKNCVDNYLSWNKVFLPQMCRELVSCADFKAILTPFSEVIWNSYSSF